MKVRGGSEMVEKNKNRKGVEKNKSRKGVEKSKKKRHVEYSTISKVIIAFIINFRMCKREGV
jgi:transcriptional regulator NrdR family protein